MTTKLAFPLACGAAIALETAALCGLAHAADGLGSLRLSSTLANALDRRPAVFAAAPPVAPRAPTQTLSLEQALAKGLAAARQGDVARALHAEDRASGAVKLAEGAFDWSFRSNNGYTRIYQYASSGGFLTTRTEQIDLLTSSNSAERQFLNGIKVRPTVALSHNVDELRPDLQRILNRPSLQVEVPLDRSFGQPADALRLQAARSELAAAQMDSEAAKQAHVHRVASAVWMLAAAQEKLSYAGELAQRMEALAARIGRLAKAGELAALAAEEFHERAALSRSLEERDAVELLAARMELATLLRLDPEELQGVRVEFPRIAETGGSSRQRVDAFVAEALARRADMRSQVERIEAARLRGKIGEREVDSQLTFTVGADRVFVNYATPLGENRRAGARQQAVAGVGAAEDAAEDLRHRVRMETRLAFERLVAATHAVARTRQAVNASRERYVLVSQMIDAGRLPPSALADAADRSAAINRQATDARLLHALALADLRKATGEVADAADPAALARLFTTEP